MNFKLILLYIVPSTVLFASAVMMFCFPNAKFPGAEYKLSKQKQKISSLATSIEKGILENSRLRQDLSLMPALRRGAISAKQNGVLVLRERFDSACSKSGITIRTVGDIQKKEEETGELVIYEVNFSAEATLKELLSLMTDFEKRLPRIYWRSLTIRPYINRNVDLLNVSGTIAMLAIGGEK